MRKKSRIPGWAWALIVIAVCVPCMAIGGAVLFPVFSQARMAARETEALSSTRSVLLATLTYVADNNDRYPLAGNWDSAVMESMTTKPKTQFAGLGPNRSDVSITYNSLLSGFPQSKMQEPGLQLVLFMSIIQEQPAAAEPDLMVFTTRNKATVGLGDGRALRATPEEVSGFRLDPEERL